MSSSPTQMERDREFILRPDDWPIWPILPLKRFRDGQAEHGFFGGDVSPTGPATVWIGNMFELSSAEAREYPSLDAVLDDGWTVD